MKKIGFFGGCFNPPTNMHIKIANNLIKEGKLDKVVFVPMNDFYKKELAFANGIKNYVEIDSSESLPDYISNSIKNSSNQLMDWISNPFVGSSRSNTSGLPNNV